MERKGIGNKRKETKRKYNGTEWKEKNGMEWKEEDMEWKEKGMK